MKPFALSQSSLSGPFGHAAPNWPNSRENESPTQVRTVFPAASVALPEQLPIDLHLPWALQATQSGWISHVNVHVSPMQWTPALSAQSAFDEHVVPTWAPMTTGALAPTQNDPRSPLSEARATQLCCGPQSVALVHFALQALSTHTVPDAQAESRHFFWHSPPTVTPGQADAHEVAASQPQSANTRPTTDRGTPRSLT
jgi:hypothetical protein